MKPGLKIYFVRHGETDWNAAVRLQGQTDIPLNALGRRQAARNGMKLSELVSDVGVVDFIASPLARTRETMEIVRGELGLPRTGYATDDRLKEVHYGTWEGRLWSELPGVDPDGFAAREADAFGWRPQGGESYSDLAERVAGWLPSLVRDTIVVSHGGTSRALRGLLYQLPFADIPHLRVPQDKVLVLTPNDHAWY